MVNAELQQDIKEQTPAPQTVMPEPGAGNQPIIAPSMDNIAGLNQPGADIDDREFAPVMEKIKPKEFEQFSASAANGAGRSIDMLLDVSLPISIELGRTAMPIQEILNLNPGSVIELDKLAGEPVDLLVNEKLIARGEVVVVDENFGIRITSMISTQDRIKSLK